MAAQQQQSAFRRAWLDVASAAATSPQKAAEAELRACACACAVAAARAGVVAPSDRAFALAFEQADDGAWKVRRVATRAATPPPPQRGFPNGLGPFQLRRAPNLRLSLKCYGGAEGTYSLTNWQQYKDLLKRFDPETDQGAPLGSLSPLYCTKPHFCQEFGVTEKHFVWVYPLWGVAARPPTQQQLDAATPEELFLLVGGWAFFSLPTSVPTTLVTLLPAATGLTFSEPRPWPFTDNVMPSSRFQGRFQELTIPALRPHAMRYCWVGPDEEDVCQPQARAEWPLGAFVYEMKEPGTRIYFALLPSHHQT
eukprot:TRINITY_DN18326_c0_g1_i1.p1 TRINITY_DN18326_c0_g1~~TRINITY_DN18326_c0_g1_i1.p1  ORF type:complete len:320 (+),score=75.18 TRINITY_DN18326_c0_g1_i1:36-962(+)